MCKLWLLHAIKTQILAHYLGWILQYTIEYSSHIEMWYAVTDRKRRIFYLELYSAYTYIYDEPMYDQCFVSFMNRNIFHSIGVDIHLNFPEWTVTSLWLCSCDLSNFDIFRFLIRISITANNNHFAKANRFTIIIQIKMIMLIWSLSM